MADYAPRWRLPAPYLHLLGALVVQLVILALAPPSWLQQGSNLVLTAWMAAATVTITWKRYDLWVVLVLGFIPAIMALSIPPQGHTTAVMLVEEILWIAFPTYLIVRIFAPLYRSREVGPHELSGAVTVLLLIGLAFADLHELIYTLEPGSLVFSNLPEGVAPDFGHFVYFSFVTLATLGYGDVSPTLHISRLVAVAESLVGLLYVTIIVARMVAMQTSRPTRPPE
jgi:hypothetical protein